MKSEDAECKNCFSPESFFDLTFTPLHLGQRTGETFIRVACLIFAFFGCVLPMKGSNTCGPKHKLYGRFSKKMEEIKDYYMNRDEGRPKLVLYRAKEGVAGNSNCGPTFK